MLSRLRSFAARLQNRHLPVRLLISLLVLIPFLLHAGAWHRFDFLTELENFAYDARLRLTLPGGRDPRIVIVDIDEKSIQQEGHWPWTRDRVARLVDQLFDEYEIRLLGCDIIFSEPDDQSALRIVDELRGDPAVPEQLRARLAERRAELETDRLFAESLIARDVVMGYSFRYQRGLGEEGRTGSLPRPLVRSEQRARITVPFPRAYGYVGVLPVLMAEATTAGYLNKPLIDTDGVTRRVALLTQYEDDLYASLGLAMALEILGRSIEFVGDPVDGVLGRGEIEALALGEGANRVVVKVDHNAAMLIPYVGAPGSFAYVPATDVISGNADVSLLRDAIVLFGSSAAGLLDLHVTPVANAHPGIEVQATIIAGLLDGKVQYRPDWARGVELFSLIAIALLVTLAIPRLTPSGQSTLLLGVAVIVVGSNLYFWSVSNFVVPVAATLVFLLLTALLQLNYGFFIESRNKRRLSRTFGQYIPQELVDEMDEAEQGASIEGESREMSVLFSDVRGFTTISEGMEPQELTRFMNAFLTPITEIIHRHRGTIDKYMGDAVMAFWGAPLDDPEHARHAVGAGMEMIGRMHELRAEFQARGWPEVHIGVGVNTGMMNVGNMGSQFRLAYTVLGDAVNLGSRLEGQTKTYDVDFIVSESTALAVPDYVFRELDRVRVKGKNEPVAIFEPLGPRAALPPERLIRLSRYQLALMLYHAQKWDLAETEFRSLNERFPHPVYAIYLERIAHFRAEPPGADWDGVYNLSTK